MKLARRGVSPIVSAIILFIIALSIAAIVLSFMWSRYSSAASIVGRIAMGVRESLERRLSVVSTAVGVGEVGLITVTNSGRLPIEVLGIYVNSSPVEPSLIRAACTLGGIYRGTPIRIAPGDVCLIVVPLRAPGLHVVSIITRTGSYTITIYG